jgi:hypothetical protein
MLGPEQGQRDNRPPASSGSGTESAAPHGPSTPPTISLPKGGGALRSIDEKFSVNAANGTCNLNIPLPFSKTRSDVGLSFALQYNSGSGNGPFGLGWNVGLPSIQRRTDSGRSGKRCFRFLGRRPRNPG